MNGIGATFAIREIEKYKTIGDKKKRIPIIGVSAGQDGAQTCIEAGMDDFIAKV
jgi:CheY-like chemotaxis protein